MNGLALFSGFGGLSTALHIAIPSFRDICHVEREAPAAAWLVAAMEARLIPQAPIWDDVSTFDGRPWRGLVDILHGGPPCQPYSVAGSRRGDADERYLWPAIFRIIEDVSPAMVFLENVPGLLAWFRPIGERLCELGFQLEAGLFSAAECGAPQKRERLFILAHSRTRDESRQPRSVDGTEPESRTGSSDGIGALAHSVRPGRQQIPGSPPRDESQDEGPSTEYNHLSASEIPSLANPSDRQLPQPRTRSQERNGPRPTIPLLAYPRFSQLLRRPSQSSILHRLWSPNHHRRTSRTLAHPGIQRLQRLLQTRPTPWPIRRSRRTTLPLFPPGPADAAAWRFVLDRWPHLAPAVEDSPRLRQHRQDRQDGRSRRRDGEAARELAHPSSRGLRTDRPSSGLTRHLNERGPDDRQKEIEYPFRFLAPGHAPELGLPRTDQLRGAGNLVSSLQGALAFSSLAIRAKIAVWDNGTLKFL